MNIRGIAVLCLLCLLPAVRNNTQASDAITLRDYNNPMLYPPAITDYYTDSVYMETGNTYLPFHFDTYFRRLATLDSEQMTDETYYFFFDIILRLPKAQALYQFDKMREMAVHTKNKQLEHEAAFWRTNYLIRDPGMSAEKVVESMQPLLDEAAKRKDFHRQIQGFSFVLETLWFAEKPDYALFFNLALSCIDKIPEDEMKSSHARYIYYMVGNAYYHFREYDKALPFLQKALSSHTPFFYDKTNLQALNALANYYATVDQPDSVFHYAKAILENNDQVQGRPMYDAIAATHIATVYLDRRLYAQAITLLNEALKTSIQEGDYAFVSQIYTGLGNAWLGNGYPDKALQMADSSRHYIQTYQCESKNQLLYSLMKAYYTTTGNTARADAYTDSIAREVKKKEDTCNTLYILRAEQTLENAVEAQQTERRQLIHSALVALSVIILLVAVGFFGFCVYQKKRICASRNLLLKGPFDTLYIPDMDPETEDIMVMDSINEAVISNQLFRDPALNTEMLASLMGITPQMIVKAVNRIQQQSFALFLTTLRVQEATRTLTDHPGTAASIEQIAIDCGFYDRKSFTRTFRQETGQSPSEYLTLNKKGMYQNN